MLELLADGEQRRARSRRDPGRVRDHPARRFAASARPERGAGSRRSVPRGRAGCTPSTLSRCGNRRVARSLPRVLGPAPGRARDRDRARQAPAPNPRREEHPMIDVDQQIKASAARSASARSRPARPVPSRSRGSTTPRSTTSGTRARTPNASHAGSSRSPATFKRAAASTSRATPRARSSAASRRAPSTRPGSTPARSRGSSSGSRRSRTANAVRARPHRPHRGRDGPSTARVPSASVGRRRDGLDQHLAGAERPKPAELVAWQTSEEGRRFNTRSSELWTEASIAAGTDPAEAREAGARTTAAYTGQPATP